MVFDHLVVSNFSWLQVCSLACVAHFIACSLLFLYFVDRTLPSMLVQVMQRITTYRYSYYFSVLVCTVLCEAHTINFDIHVHYVLRVSHKH